jgi:ubiquinone/menaquinone biosynthesis C-methylase UbiE
MTDPFRYRFSAIAHARLPYCNPIAPHKLDRVLDLLSGHDGLRALDVGCGRADLLVRLAERFGATGVGLDLSERFLAEGRRRLADRCPDAAIELVQTDIAEYPLPATPFDLVACVGGPYERIEAAWQHLGRFLHPGGFLLWGGPYWQQPPAAEYLAFLDMPADGYTTHAANILDGEALGLVPLYATVASPDDWDHYEGTYAGSIERHLLDHPDDPDAEAMRQRLRPWRDAYLRWGRGTLGFGLYLFAWPG